MQSHEAREIESSLNQEGKNNTVEENVVWEMFLSPFLENCLQTLGM